MFSISYLTDLYLNNWKQKPIQMKPLLLILIIAKLYLDI